MLDLSITSGKMTKGRTEIFNAAAGPNDVAKHFGSM
jgi:hypothetical protein